MPHHIIGSSESKGEFGVQLLPTILNEVSQDAEDNSHNPRVQIQESQILALVPI